MDDEPSAGLPRPRAATTLEAATHARLVAVVAAASTHGPVALRRLWEDLLTAYGAEAASRVWQEALSSSDVGQT